MHKDVKSVFAVLTGTGGAQLIALLFTPLLTRLYSPEAFGHLGVFLALAAVLVPIAALTLPMAIVLCKTTHEAKITTNLALRTALLNSLLFLVMIFLSFNYLVDILNAGESAHYLYWLPLLVFFSALLQLSENWVIKLSFFKLKAKVSILHAFIINGLKLLLGLWLPSAAMLIFIAIINPLLNVLLLFTPIKNSVFSKTKMSFQLNRRWKIMLYKHRYFPLFQAPQALLNALSQSAPVIMIAAFFGPVAAGFYTFSRSILAIPIILIGKAMGDVFYGRIVLQINERRYNAVKKLFIQATLLLMVIGLVPLSIVLVYGPELFAFFFGEHWFQAGIYAQYLSLWTFFILINAPSLKLITALKRQKSALIINVISTSVRIAVLFVGGYYFKDEWLTLLLFVTISITHNLIIILLAYVSCSHKVDLAKVKIEI